VRVGVGVNVGVCVGSTVGIGDAVCVGVGVCVGVCVVKTGAAPPEVGLGAIPISLGPEDADRCHGDRRQGRGRARWWRALEREITHLALDGAGVVACAAGRESLGTDLGQHTG
jgi:hypothetical protein